VLIAYDLELTQEFSAMGLTMVYAFGDAESRAELLQTLLDSLDSSSRTNAYGDKLPIKVSAGEENPVVATYRELYGIASDLNQPGLVYRFMALASYDQMRSTRRGLATDAAKSMRTQIELMFINL
jgi:proteasome component ECM29